MCMRMQGDLVTVMANDGNWITRGQLHYYFMFWSCCCFSYDETEHHENSLILVSSQDIVPKEMRRFHYLKYSAVQSQLLTSFPSLDIAALWPPLMYSSGDFCVDPMMQDQIDSFIANGHASFEVQLLVCIFLFSICWLGFQSTEFQSAGSCN